MVVLLDLDEDTSDLHIERDGRQALVFHNVHKGQVVTATALAIKQYPMTDVRAKPNPNINGFSAALSCYPVISQIARFIDLNTLHALSRTCHQFRANLVQFRKQLVAQSLRCEKERMASLKGVEAHIQDSEGIWHIFGDGGVEVGRLTTGKNCTSKPPSASYLPNRHRRLCVTCLAAPLACHINHLLESTAACPVPAFTAPAFARTPCTCSDIVWLCQPCGREIHNADTIYKRIWTWRTRYSTYLGGLGTGIGEGNEGVECARRGLCLAAKENEVEIDCGGASASPSSSPSSSPPSSLRDAMGSDDEIGVDNLGLEKAGYLRQEVEGIGGVMKKKVKKRDRIGSTVREHKDEREHAEYLSREINGEDRSWCGWCWRVIPGSTDKDEIDGTQE